MANEGSTKATYSELEAQAAQAANDLSRVKELTRILADEHKLRQAAQNETERVRGLLQRQSDALCGMIATFESGDHADKSSEFGICSTGMCAVCDAQEALDAAMSDIQIPTDAKSDKNPPWIGVEERLPDYQARSIIYLPEGWIGCGWRSELRGGVWLVENCDGVEPYQAGHPTHWMPLPSPPTFPQSSSPVPEGAESADIGKLDTADKSGVEMGKVNGVDESMLKFASLVDAFLCKHFGEYDRGEHPDADELFDLCADLSGVAARKLDAGSAETGGEKAAPQKCKSMSKAGDLYEPQCCQLKAGHNGKHFAQPGKNFSLAWVESREPEKLNNAQNAKCFICGESTNPLGCNPSEWPIRLPFANGNGRSRTYCTKCVVRALAESSLSSPPPEKEK